MSGDEKADAEQKAIDSALYELHVAALTVSTDLAQDCLEDPIGWHTRETQGWRRLAVSASNRLRDALQRLPRLPEGYSRAADERRALDACFVFLQGWVNDRGRWTSPQTKEAGALIAAVERARAQEGTR